MVAPKSKSARVIRSLVRLVKMLIRANHKNDANTNNRITDQIDQKAQEIKDLETNNTKRDHVKAIEKHLLVSQLRTVIDNHRKLGGSELSNDIHKLSDNTVNLVHKDHQRQLLQDIVDSTNDVIKANSDVH